MDGDVWDEERWEAFLKENDRRLEHYMTLLFRFMSDNPPAGQPGSEARREWEGDLRSFLAANGISADDILPRSFSGDESDEEEMFTPGGAFLHVDESDDALDDVRNLSVYTSAHRLAARVLKWSNQLPGRVKDSTLVQFCSHITQIPSNLAKGHGIGYEMEMLGGNIACAKRALASANAALELLRELKSAGYMDDRRYQVLYEESFELRNQIGIYVQELRHRFDLGVD